MRGRCAGKAPRLARRLRAPSARGGRRLRFGLGRRLRLALLDVFERQQQLIVRQALGAAAEAVALQVLDDLNEPFCALALGDQHRLQRLGIVGKRLGGLRHAPDDTMIREAFATIFEPLIHFAAGQPGSCGADVSFAAPTRRQSRPSMSAESCAADNASRRSRSSAIGTGRLRGVLRTDTRPCRPRNQLYPVGAFGAEHVDRAVERIGAHHVANQRRQTFRPFAEVDRPRRHQHAHRARRTDHFAAFSAPMIAVTIATSAPGHTQTLDPSMSNSIECGRASPVLFAPPTSGDCTVLGASTTTGAKAAASTATSILQTRLADARRTTAAASDRGGARRG